GWQAYTFANGDYEAAGEPQETVYSHEVTTTTIGEWRISEWDPEHPSRRHVVRGVEAVGAAGGDPDPAGAFYGIGDHRRVWAILARRPLVAGYELRIQMVREA